MLKSEKTKFGKMVSVALVNNSKTQKELAYEVGLSPVAVSQLLIGIYKPSAKTLYGISKSTGISMEKLAEALFDES